MIVSRPSDDERAVREAAGRAPRPACGLQPWVQGRDGWRVDKREALGDPGRVRGVGPGGKAGRSL